MPSRNSSCSCGSGKRFKHCCGALTADRTASKSATPYAKFGDFQQHHRGRGMLPFVAELPAGMADGLAWAPPGLLVRENFLDAATCERWTDYFSRQQSAPVRIQKVRDVAPGGEPEFVLDERRVTERVQLGALENEIKQVVYGAYRDETLPHFGKELDWMDRPDVLKYVAGGKYIVHSDNEYWDTEAGRWIRSMDRDLSVLLYTNDDYEGGSLYFQNFDIRIKPSRGTLVAFPSDNRFLHAAEPLLSGSRFVVVCWSSVKGVEKIHPVPRGVTRTLH